MGPDIPIQFKPEKIRRFSNALAIHLVDFPIYHIECISERHFLIAGGGGSSKTGVRNQINILELVPNGDLCAANLVMKYYTPDEIPDAIMTGSLMRDLPIINTRFIAGGTHLTIYNIIFNRHERRLAITDYELLKDRQVKAEIKSVKYIPGKILTGGVDGQLTIWDITSNNKKIQRQIRAHSKEIDEIDVDLENEQIVTLSRDEARCVIWSLVDLKLIQEFDKEFIDKSETTGHKNRYRSCRYAYDLTLEARKSPFSSSLLISCNPIQNKGSSKLYKLDSNNYKKFNSEAVTTDGVMAMTVSLDGKFVAIGTRSGSVSVLEVKNLKRIYNFTKAHSNAITKLEFLAPKPESLILTNSETCALLSVSFDRRIVLHRPKRSSLTFSLLLKLIMVFSIYWIFVLMYKIYTS